MNQSGEKCGTIVIKSEISRKLHNQFNYIVEMQMIVTFEIHHCCRMCDAVVYQDSSYVTTQVHLLQEMFPGACSIEVQHCLTIAEGDVARAAQLVLHRQEVGQSLSSTATVLQVSSNRNSLQIADTFCLISVIILVTLFGTKNKS